MSERMTQYRLDHFEKVIQEHPNDPQSGFVARIFSELIAEIHACWAERAFPTKEGVLNWLYMRRGGTDDEALRGMLLEAINAVKGFES